MGERTPQAPGSVGLVFSLFFFANLSVLAIQFTRRTSILMGLVFVVILVLSGVSSFVGQLVEGVLSQGLFMNTSFYWMWCLFLVCLISGSILWSRGQYWTVRDGELIRHRIFRSESSWPLVGLTHRVDIHDVVQYAMLRAGRLIIQPNPQDGPIVIDHVPQIRSISTRLEEATQLEVSRLIPEDDSVSVERLPETLPKEEPSAAVLDGDILLGDDEA